MVTRRQFLSGVASIAVAAARPVVAGRTIIMATGASNYVGPALFVQPGFGQINLADWGDARVQRAVIEAVFKACIIPEEQLGRRR